MFNHKELNIPDQHGVYQYYDKQNTLIYVGKAKSLLKRVGSYFTGDKDNKTQSLVKSICDIKWIITNSEFESLQLENSLIKQHQPKYNILLKDDKTYPYIVIKNENFPRIYYTRKKLDDSSEYFGPYPSSKYCDSLISLIEDLYPLRTCSLNLSLDNISSGKFKSCIQKEIGKCLAPCISLQTKDNYDRSINSIRKILNGDIDSVIKMLNILIESNANKLQFEICQSLKNKLDIISAYKSKFQITQSIGDKEVYIIKSDENSFWINYTFVKDGLINKSINHKIDRKLNETEEEVLSHYILYLRGKYKKTGELISNISVLNSSTDELLINSCLRDLKHFILLHKISEPTTKEVLMSGIQSDLRLKDTPIHIECFDNSNLSGTNPVSSVVVFRNGEPSKKEYRWFNIDLGKPDDYETMYQAVIKRYKGVSDLPQLIIIDGGKGQLSSAVKALKDLCIYGQVSIISIAKKLEEIYYPDDSLPLYLNKRSYTLRLIQQIRDEAHRFGIEKHRNKRSKSMLESELDKIHGLGSISKEKLLTKYKSMSDIRLTSNEEITELLGKKIGNYLISYLIQY